MTTINHTKPPEHRATTAHRYALPTVREIGYVAATPYEAAACRRTEVPRFSPTVATGTDVAKGSGT
jgi:hypothetical protein